jgi:hypothetical protein
MPHARQTIREATATLVTSLTSTGTRVFQSRMVPTAATLPCLLVTTNDEEIEAGAFEKQLDRRLSVQIIGVAKAASASLDDALDTIAAEVETAIGTNLKYELRAITVDFDESLEKPTGRITLDFSYRYFTNAGAPGTTL